MQAVCGDRRSAPYVSEKTASQRRAIVHVLVHGKRKPGLWRCISATLGITTIDTYAVDRRKACAHALSNDGTVLTGHEPWAKARTDCALPCGDVVKVARMDDVGDERRLKVGRLRKERVARMMQAVRHGLRDGDLVQDAGKECSEHGRLLTLRVACGRRWRGDTVGGGRGRASERSPTFFVHGRGVRRLRCPIFPHEQISHGIGPTDLQHIVSRALGSIDSVYGYSSVMRMACAS
jgi:hypothetical protein